MKKAIFVLAVALVAIACSGKSNMPRRWAWIPSMLQRLCSHCLRSPIPLHRACSRNVRHRALNRDIIYVTNHVLFAYRFEHIQAEAAI